MPIVQYFAYLGPNRRSDKRLVEVAVDAVPGEQYAPLQNKTMMKELLVAGGVLKADEKYPVQELPDEPLANYASLLVQTALLFQQRTNHRVSFYSVFKKSSKGRCIALMEHEHCDVGLTAVKLAHELLEKKLKSVTEPFRQFYQFAQQRLLPLETEAIINAAHERDIPCIQLDRYPFQRNKKQVGVRRNGLLMLGHGANHHVLDGTFCLDKSTDRSKEMLMNPARRRALLEELGLPLLAEPIDGDAKETIQIFVVNDQVTAVVAANGDRTLAVEDLHSSIHDHAIEIQRNADGFPIKVILLTADITNALEQSSGCVVDFELAPHLDPLASPQSPSETQALKTTVNKLLDWLFPDKESIRIPIIALTGTNGKTTTSRMINHVMISAGRHPGMVTTDGIYLNGTKSAESDSSSLIGHTKVLTNNAVDAAVLESHHRGIFMRGFAFDWCDIAVCLNVTADHLDDENITSVEEMAVVKRALLERARYAAVLNADNKHCLDMISHLGAERLCLVSMQSDVDGLKTHVSEDRACFCVLESIDDDEWIMMYDRARKPVMPVTSIPATFEGQARFNVSNAMHAIAACYLAGIDAEFIRSGMQGFDMSFENTPGRLNFYDAHPFRVLVDFAHNLDGMLQLCEFVDRLEVSGRRLLMFQVKDGKGEQYARTIAAAAVGHFDHYVCRTHPLDPGEDHQKIPLILKDALMNSGVKEDQIMVMTDPALATDTMLKMGKKGDLLVFTPGDGQARADNWKQVTSFQSDVTGLD
jgi:UDP-N-acetylmuramyl tripeptide synthase